MVYFILDNIIDFPPLPNKQQQHINDNNNQWQKLPGILKTVYQEIEIEFFESTNKTNNALCSDFEDNESATDDDDDDTEQSEDEGIFSTDESDDDDQVQENAVKPKKHITFATCVSTTIIINWWWNTEAQTLRCSNLSQQILDKQRFARRIQECNEALSWVFTPEHRAKIIMQRENSSIAFN